MSQKDGTTQDSTRLSALRKDLQHDMSGPHDTFRRTAAACFAWGTIMALPATHCCLVCCAAGLD